MRQLRPRELRCIVLMRITVILLKNHWPQRCR